MCRSMNALVSEVKPAYRATPARVSSIGGYRRAGKSLGDHLPNDSRHSLTKRQQSEASTCGGWATRACVFKSQARTNLTHLACWSNSATTQPVLSQAVR